MLNTIFYLSNKYSDFSYTSSANYDPQYFTSFIIDASEIETLKDAYIFFSTKQISKFSISLIVNNPIEKDFIDYLLAFLFLPEYLKINNQIIINLLGSNTDVINEAKKKIIETSGAQCINNLEINILHPYELKNSDNVKYMSNYVFFNLDDFKLHSQNTLQSPSFYNNTFYLHYSATDVDTLSSLIITANGAVKTNNRPLYDLILKFQSLQIEKSDLKLKYTCLANELENYKTHLIMLKSLHEATHLQMFYDNEYEILPLWYKRFGHVLKVMMGKRSFRSLFNNNIKKS